jgi:cyclophilin family peptidyl-prolyl cis-trans isomerase
MGGGSTTRAFIVLAVLAAVRQSPPATSVHELAVVPVQTSARAVRLASPAPLAAQAPEGSRAEALRHPDSSTNARTAPERYWVRLETTKGVIVIEVYRPWAPHGADRFFNLVADGYYDGSRFFRVIQGKWAQFGINGDPAVSTAWRTRTIPDDPRVESNTRGTVAFAFAVANGRTTQVFINLRDNSATHDREPFVPFGRVVEGLEVADALNSEYGEASGSGIRAGKQDPLFQGGNAYLAEHFPRLDAVTRATVEQ